MNRFGIVLITFSIMIIALLALSSCARRVVYVQHRPPVGAIDLRPAAPYADAFWVPGRWAWNNGDYFWISGHWQRGRAGYAWIPGHWQRTRHGYVWRKGRWRRR